MGKQAQDVVRVETPEGIKEYLLCPYCLKPIREDQKGGMIRLKGVNHWVCKKMICIAKLSADHAGSHY